MSASALRTSPGPRLPSGALEIAKLLNEWRADPERFVREALGAEPETWQVEALRRMARPRARLAIRSGHGVGKTTFLAWLILWFGSTSDDAKVGVTAPAAPQIETNLWPEIRKWHKAMAATGPVGMWLSRQIEIVQDAVKWSNGNRCTARTARPDQPEALQGLHASDTLVLADEASGIPDIVFEASSGALSTPDAKVCMTGNPTRPSGYFFNAFHAGREFWSTMKVGQADVRPERVDRAFIAEAEAMHGRDSNYYRVRVLGEFPTAADDTLIPLDVIEAAFVREVAQIERNVVWGLDVARFGDDASALAIRRGNKLLEPVTVWRGLDTMQIVGRVMQRYRETPKADLPVQIAVDVIGIGAGVVDRMLELRLPAVGINVAESAAVSERYLRLRDELWFAARDWLKGADVWMARDDGLAADLSAPTYSITSSGKLAVEQKAETKKRLGRSPDRGDAFVLTFALGETRPKVDAAWNKELRRHLSASRSWRAG